VNLIAYRPNAWVEVIGQDRVLRLISCILKTERFMPRGYVFQGPVGVGKTTVAYLLARALMCTGNDPMGCGQCPSCNFIDKADGVEQGLSLSADFLEVDASSNSGVEHARNLMDIMNAPPSGLSRRRVIIIDEAHQLTKEAWDVYLKPLETKDTTSIFIFVSNHSDGIPYSIRSRLTPINFERVHTDLIFGLMINISNKHKIQYEHEALQIIAQRSKGIVREAVLMLGIVASMGALTKALVEDALHDNLEDLCLKCYSALISNNQIEAIKWIDAAGQNYNTNKVIETLFSIYAHTPWADPGTLYAQIASRLPNVSEVDSIFIKWMTNTNLPTDTLPLVIYELINTLDIPANVRVKAGSKVSSKPVMGGVASFEKAINFLNG
jgi:DNA polymerase-3 subunit gamma/tau